MPKMLITKHQLQSSKQTATTIHIFSFPLEIREMIYAQLHLPIEVPMHATADGRLGQKYWFAWNDAT
jgi:hypothetical protein